jgi:hypothetical protein
MPRSNDALRELERAWTQAETRGDTDTLGALATQDFRLVGPAGVMLTKRQGQCSSGSGCAPAAHLLGAPCSTLVAASRAGVCRRVDSAAPAPGIGWSGTFGEDSSRPGS